MKRERQLKFEKTGGWGGKRRGSGRKNRSKTVNHMKRERVTGQTPVHITMKLKRGISSLRKAKLLEDFMRASRGSKRYGLFVLHFAIQHNHLHFIAECTSNKALGAGMRSLGGRFAKSVRKRTGASGGGVFNDRYHLHVLKTPAETRNALKYVLMNNLIHHGGTLGADQFSSGPVFSGWKFFRKKPRNPPLGGRSWISDDLYGAISPPRSWLCRAGWLKGT